MIGPEGVKVEGPVMANSLLNEGQQRGQQQKHGEHQQQDAGSGQKAELPQIPQNR